MSDALVERVKATIRDVPDFPKPGILFKDITPVLKDARLLQDTLTWFASSAAGVEVTSVIGMESRGFIFGAAVAPLLNAGFVPARKKGKLPWNTEEVTYDLEYGTATLALHQDAVLPGDRILIVDDLLATGGTAKATIELVEKLGGVVVGAVFLIELDFLSGRENLGVPVRSLLHY